MCSMQSSYPVSTGSEPSILVPPFGTRSNKQVESSGSHSANLRGFAGGRVRHVWKGQVEGCEGPEHSWRGRGLRAGIKVLLTK
jgi:hypothetical protein